MFDIKKEYVVTEENKKKAVLIDIKTFEKIEEVLPLDKARAYYSGLKKD